jgi:hypothetical protein
VLCPALKNAKRTCERICNAVQYDNIMRSYSGQASVNPNPSGALGSCGVDSHDDSFTVAISPSWMGTTWPPAMCGRQITLTNTGPTTDGSVGGIGNVVTVTVEDTCEGCGLGDLDLSVAAWDALTNNAAWSVVGISW